MKPFARFLSKKDYDLLMNGLIKEAKLRERVIRLQNYRKNGIRTLEEAERFEKEGPKKEEENEEENEEEEEEEKEEDSKASKMVEEVRAAEDGLLVAQELPRQ